MTISRSKSYHVLQARTQHLTSLIWAFNCITVPEGSISGLVDQLVMIARRAPCPYTRLNISHKTGEPFVPIIHSLLIYHHNWKTPITYLFARRSKQLIRKSSDSRPCHKSNILCGKIHTAHTFSNEKQVKYGSILFPLVGMIQDNQTLSGSCLATTTQLSSVNRENIFSKPGNRSHSQSHYQVIAMKSTQPWPHFHTICSQTSMTLVP